MMRYETWLELRRDNPRDKEVQRASAPIVTEPIYGDLDWNQLPGVVREVIIW